MKKFSHYVMYRDDIDLATALVEANVDVDAWVQHITDLVRNYELTENQMYTELLAGLGGVASAAMGGAKPSFGGAVQGALGAIGRGAQWAQQNVPKAAQWAKNSYAQGEIDNVMKKIAGLRQTLATVFPQQAVDNWITNTNAGLKNAINKIAQRTAAPAPAAPSPTAAPAPTGAPATP